METVLNNYTIEIKGIVYVNLTDFPNLSFVGFHRIVKYQSDFR